MEFIATNEIDALPKYLPDKNPLTLNDPWLKKPADVIKNKAWKPYLAEKWLKENIEKRDQYRVIDKEDDDYDVDMELCH